MNLWRRFSLATDPNSENNGITFHFEQGLDPALKRHFVALAKWLRQHYRFPVHLNVYILSCETVTVLNGDAAYGAFRWYPKRHPRIRIASKIEAERLAAYSTKDNYDMVLSSLIHELTHYYQWVLKLNQSESQSERQANYYRYRILDEFYKEHPL